MKEPDKSPYQKTLPVDTAIHSVEIMLATLQGASRLDLPVAKAARHIHPSQSDKAALCILKRTQP